MDDAEVFRRLAEGLAGLREPTLEDAPSDDVLRAMQTVFGFSGPDPQWLAGLQQEVAALSGGGTTLTVADREEFSALTKQPGAAYLAVSDGRNRRLVLMGPFVPPVQYDEGRPGDPDASRLGCDPAVP